MDHWGWMDPQNPLWRRDDGGNGFGDGGVNDNSANNQGFAFQGNGTSQSALINEFRFQAAKSIRTSTIILAVFNVVAAFATAVGILWDSYATKKRNDPRFKFRTSGFSFIGPTETFPLVMSIGIIIQGSVFAWAQSTGLESLLILGCTITSQMMLPAVFIVPYIQFIFGVETTIRALRRQPFPPRGKWTVAGCITILGTLLLVTFLVTHFLPAPNFCFGSLFWFVQRWKDGIFAAFVIIASTTLICPGIIFWRLHASCKIDPTERIAASRMVYYLAVACISVTIMIPFFYSLLFMDLRTAGPQPLNLAMIASVVANLTGLMTGGLHLFLRSNCLSTIGPRDKCELERKKLKAGIRLHNSNDDYGYSEFGGSSSGSPSFGRVDSATTIGNGKEEEDVQSPSGTPTYKEPHPLRSQGVNPNAQQQRGQAAPTPPSAVQSLKDHIRKSSYSLFPRNSALKSFTFLPATTYAPSSKSRREQEELGFEVLEPPPRVHATGVQHRRDGSVDSHATVQIGLRFSNAEDAPQLNSRYYADTEKVHNLGCPNERGHDASNRPSPLSGASATKPDRANDTIADAYLNSANRKTLPPIPPGESPIKLPPTLTAAVYSPTRNGSSPAKTKVTSPQGVGFNTPSRVNSPKSPPRCFKPDCNCDGRHKAEWI